jgi:hypothetical protein
MRNYVKWFCQVYGLMQTATWWPQFNVLLWCMWSTLEVHHRGAIFESLGPCVILLKWRWNNTYFNCHIARSFSSLGCFLSTRPPSGFCPPSMSLDLFIQIISICNMTWHDINSHYHMVCWKQHIFAFNAGWRHKLSTEGPPLHSITHCLWTSLKRERIESFIHLFHVHLPLSRLGNDKPRGFFT